MARGYKEEISTAQVLPFCFLSAPDKEVIMKMDEIALEVDSKSRNLYLTNGEWKLNKISFSHNLMAGVQLNYSAVTYEV